MLMIAILCGAATMIVVALRINARHRRGLLREERQRRRAERVAAWDRMIATRPPRAPDA